MSICPNCQTKTHGNFCPHCGTLIVQPTATQSTPKKGKLGAIARIAVAALIVINLLNATVQNLFNATDLTFGEGLIQFLSECGLAFMMAAFVCGFMKWCVFIGSRSLRWANRFWCSWYALGLFGVAIKAMIWISIIVAPFLAYSFVMIPMYPLMMHIAYSTITVPIALLLFIGFGALLALLMILDFRKLFTRNNVNEGSEHNDEG